MLLIPTILFRGIAVQGERTVCWQQPFVITGITLRWPRALPAKIVKRAAVSVRVPRILLCRLCGLKGRT